ncbi:MAG: hypothetical protein AABZ60_04220 [Planctomycetota bacterium]
MWWIYWREFIWILTLFLSLGAILYFSKKNDLELLFRGFSIAFCAKKIFMGTLGTLLFILISWGVFWLAQAPVENPFGALNSGLAILLYQGNSLFSSFPLFSQESYTYSLNHWQLFLTQCTHLKTWDLLALLFVALFLLSYYGGIISRLVVVEVATGNVPSLKSARLFVRKRFSSYLGPLFLVAGGILFLAGTNALMGFFSAFTNSTLQSLGFESSRIGYVLLALALPLMMILSFIIFMLIVGGLFAFFFFQTSASIEGGDFFDTFSRSFSYFFARPWLYLFYNLVAWSYGGVVLTLVSLMSLGILFITFQTAAIGFHLWSKNSFTETFLNQLSQPGWEPHQIFFSTLIFLFASALIGLWVSYGYSIQACICLLIRKSYDLIDIKNIYLEDEPVYEFEGAGFMTSTPPMSTAPINSAPPPSSPEPRSESSVTSSSSTTSEKVSLPQSASSGPEILSPSPGVDDSKKIELFLEMKEVALEKTEEVLLPSKIKAPVIVSSKSYPKKPFQKKKKK